MFYPGYLITCGSAPAAINSFVVEEHGNLQTCKTVVISKHLPRGASIAVAFALIAVADSLRIS